MSTITRDDPRYDSAQQLLAAALEFWTDCHKANQLGAVQWLEGADGSLLIFTRGEYRQTLMASIERLPNQALENLFMEELESEDTE